MNPKHPLFLTYYNKITAITGSVPPSPREKASAQRPTIFSYGNAGHFRLYRIILDPVGANPRVRPTILSCPTVFIKKTAASYPWAHTSVRPYVVGILSVGAHIGAPLRRQGSVALLFTYMANRSCLFSAETVQRAKAFSRGEGFGARGKQHQKQSLAGCPYTVI